MKKNQQGFLSIIAIILVVIVGLIGSAAAYQLVGDTRQAGNSLHSSQAYYVAQSGVDYAKHFFAANTASCGASFNNVSFPGAKGTFSVTSSLNNVTHDCTLISTAGVPDLTNPISKRTLQAVLSSSGISTSSLVASGDVSLKGNITINNLFVSSNSPNYDGSTILSGGTVKFTGGSAITAVSDLSPSSNTSQQNADVVSGDTTLGAATLFNQFFSGTKATTAAAATLVTSDSQLQTLPAPNGMYYANPAFNLNSNYTVGTAANPVIVIVNGDITINGNVTINGLLYVIGNLTIMGNAVVNGGIVAEGSVSKASGNATINFNPTILNKLYTPGSTVLHFYDSPASIKEIIA